MENATSSSPTRHVSEAWLSELLPQTAKVADELCFIKTVNTEAINHDPAMTLASTGNQQPGYASMDGWLNITVR